MNVDSEARIMKYRRPNSIEATKSYAYIEETEEDSVTYSSDDHNADDVIVDDDGRAVQMYDRSEQTNIASKRKLNYDGELNNHRAKHLGLTW